MSRFTELFPYLVIKIVSSAGCSKVVMLHLALDVFNTKQGVRKWFYSELIVSLTVAKAGIWCEEASTTELSRK